MQPAGRRLQDWTNKNLFATSIDEFVGYQEEDQIQESDEIEKDVIDDAHGNIGQPITALQAAWNVTNAIQGMFIVGLPVAVKVGGWWTIGALVGVAYMCYWTGVRFSYKEVADKFHPGMGRLVLVAQLTELLSTCIIYIVIAGDLLQSCIPSIDKSAWMMLVSATLLSCAFLDSIRIVSNLSLANAISHLIVNAILVLYCISQASNWVWNEVPFALDIRTMPTMIGVVVFGYTSHIFLPSLEASMRDPSEFKWMLKWSHIIAALFKSVFGLLGFLTFGELTQNEISNSLPNQSFKVVVNLVLVVKALLSYPLPYFAAVQLLKDNLFLGVKKTLFSRYVPLLLFL
uniref:Aa_trans domain-containing protein n=1 Tax=Ascaris lumbricoides TaxID=6252 RepID=A0A0M3IFW8_ASCLU